MGVTGEYDINEVPGQQVDMMVTDTKGQHFVNRESTDKGKFAFTTDDYDVFEICFISRVPTNMRGARHEVFLQTKHGVEAKNYENLGDAAKLKPLEVELKRLEDLSESIVQDFAHMRQREEEMRDTNESTISLFSPCVACWVWQHGRFSTSENFSSPKNLSNNLAFIWGAPDSSETFRAKFRNFKDIVLAFGSSFE